ncbi:hypothetical protein PG993_001395 [Apiospora rasikravindrae]|uniref:Uncharacterized protein n=1 Tax=Apiospora rasikravindrae TaxID=990691 RepID=A0ABR1UB83_9PEZI
MVTADGPVDARAASYRALIQEPSPYVLKSLGGPLVEGAGIRSGRGLLSNKSVIIRVALPASSSSSSSPVGRAQGSLGRLLNWTRADARRSSASASLRCS